MQLTERNTGDIIFMYQTGKRVKVDSVTDENIYFVSEQGTKYATKDRYIEGIKDTDPSSTAIFENNAMIGKCLNAARSSALKKLQSDLSPKDKEDADLVWQSTKKQLDHLNNNIAALRGVVSRSLVNEFLSELYERGSGSHDHFMGHHVEVSSSWRGEFKISGKTYDINSASEFLFQKGREPVKTAPVKEHKSLNDIISNADARQRAAAESGKDQISHKIER